MEFLGVLAYCSIFLVLIWVLRPPRGKPIGSVNCRGGGLLRWARELEVQRTNARRQDDVRIVLRVVNTLLGSPLDLREASSLADILAWNAERAPRGAVGDLIIDAADEGSDESRVEIAFWANDEDGKFVRSAYVDLDRFQAEALARLLRTAISKT